MDCNYLRTKSFLKIYSLDVRFQPRARYRTINTRSKQPLLSSTWQAAHLESDHLQAAETGCSSPE